jgi:hypothetical protein
MQKHHRTINCDSRYVSSFGFDIHIANNANTTMKSYSRMGFTYKHPQYAYGTNEANTFLAGSMYFELSEIEIYKKD